MITLEMIHEAQQGCETSLSNLTEEVKGRVYILLYRLTLDYHLVEDLAQDTMIGLVQSLKELDIRSVKSFWAWVYRTAIGKMQHHYRIQGTKRIEQKTSFDTELLNNVTKSCDEEPIRRLLKKESIESIWAAMNNLKTDYRSVLILRCIDGLPYAQIAQILGGTQIRVRMMLQRAKRALRKQLTSHGLGKSDFAEVIALFAMVTAISTDKSSAVMLAAGSVKSGLTSVFAGKLISKTTLTILGLLLVITISVSFLISETPQTNSADFDLLSREAASAPIFDESLNLIYDDPRSGYSTLDQVSRSNHPSDENWKHFVFYPSLQPARMLNSAIDDTTASLLVLGKDQWIEYEIPRDIQDNYGPEIAIYIFNWGLMPSFFVTDGQSRQKQIFASTYNGSFPNGPKALGFDLSSHDIPFEIRGIRISGNDNAGPYKGCGIDPPKVYLEPIKTVSRNGT